MIEQTVQNMGKGPFLLFLFCAVIGAVVLVCVGWAVVETIAYAAMLSRERVERLDGGKVE